jgi:hypothetical protein
MRSTGKTMFWILGEREIQVEPCSGSLGRSVLLLWIPGIRNTGRTMFRILGEKCSATPDEKYR